jgi:type IV protein arginine methyltransferase
MSFDDIDLDTRTQEILLAASNHDLDALKPFLRVPGAASVQDPETGFTPLHAAIAACGHAPQHIPRGSVEFADGPLNGTTNGHSHESTETVDEDEEVDIEKSKATVKELFLSGAIWNDLDMNNETPGCLAWRLGQKDLYELVVEAGVRAELLMNLMGGYEQLPDEDEDDDVEEEEEADMTIGDSAKQPTNTNTSVHTTPPHPAPDPEPSQHQDITSEGYLASSLIFIPSKLLDASSNGVMMSWERPIMELTAKLVAPSPSLRILNIGFGMGIIDRLFAATEPAVHHIIEAHPDVIARLRSAPTLGGGGEGEGGIEEGGESDNFAFFGPEWLKKEEGRNVIYEGKWQDIVPKLLKEELVFDVIYFDTFGEDYSQLKTFFTEYVVALLASDGRFSFFNGLGADRRVCYDVYCRVVELDLCDAGLDVEWVDVDVDMGEGEGGTRDGSGGEGHQGLGREGEGEWEGVRRRYWTLEKVGFTFPPARSLLY